MRNTSACIYKIVLGVVLCGMILWLAGCGLTQQPGETTAKGHRRHIRNVRINQQGLMRDVDRLLLSDRPQRTMDRRVPPEISE